MTADANIEGATGATTTSDMGVGDFSIPQEYAEKKWSKDINSIDDLWKSYDGAQNLIGNRPAGIPDFNTASPEEVATFNKSFGVPDTPDAYEFNLPEGVELNGTDEKARNIFHEAGLNKNQADVVMQKYMEMEAQAQADMDTQFDEVIQKHFGETFEQDQKQVHDVVSKYVPEDLRAGFEAMPPQALAALVSLTKGLQGEVSQVKKQYGAEDTLTAGNTNSAQSIEDVRKELAALRFSEPVKNFQHPDHDKAVKRIAELSQTVQRHFNK